MPPARAQIKELVLETLVNYVPGLKARTISEGDNPFRDYGLESIDGIGFACDLSRKLDLRIPKGDNPFVDDTKKAARNLGQIIDHIHFIVGQPIGRSTHESRRQ